MPLYRGLDDHSCYQVVSLLKHLAAQGRTIICTIHQPSARLFQMFEQVYILAMGECLYQGGTEKIVPYLQSINLPCPKYHNPADYSNYFVITNYYRNKTIWLLFPSFFFALIYRNLLENYTVIFGFSTFWENLFCLSFRIYFDSVFNYNLLKLIVVELACGEYGLDKIKTMVESMDNGECIDWFSNPDRVHKLEALRQKYPIRQYSKEDGSVESIDSFHQLRILLRRGWIKTKRDATLTHLR